MPTCCETLYWLSTWFRQLDNLGIHNGRSVEQSRWWIVIWDQSDRRKWYLAKYRQHVDATHFLLEYLELVLSLQTKKCWQYPLRQDEQIILINQIIPVNVVGSCNMKGQNYIFEVKNLACDRWNFQRFLYDLKKWLYINLLKKWLYTIIKAFSYCLWYS